jgi:hypothetical protein
MVVFIETVDHGYKILWCMEICENISFKRTLRSCSILWNNSQYGSCITVFHHFPDSCMVKYLVYSSILYIFTWGILKSFFYKLHIYWYCSPSNFDFGTKICYGLLFMLQFKMPRKYNEMSCVAVKCRMFMNSVRFEVFVVVTMKNAIFWDVMPCGCCENQCFRGT